VVLVAFMLPATGFLQLPVILAVAALAAFVGGMATTALYTNMMDRCDPHTAASDFTLQQSLSAVGPIFAAAFSGFSAAGLGYPVHFVICALIALAAPLLAARRLQATHAAPIVLEPSVDAGAA
jgi:PAT family beta-lactamase induction signal transducer AmpG